MKKYRQKEILITVVVTHRFVLSSMESSSETEPAIHYTGLSTEAVSSGLKPFTQYTVILEVGMTNVHCLWHN